MVQDQNIPKISIVVSMSQNRVIGKGNRLLWHLKGDLVRLKDLTLGRIVVLGRKTYDSMAGYYDQSGRPMPGKLYIVVTRDKEYKPTRDNAAVAYSLEEAFGLAKRRGEAELFVIGGQQVFEQTLPLAEKLYLTIINKDFEGDVFFPDYSAFSKEIFREEGESANGLKFTFLELEKPN